ncbi:MAG TPA: hypothetical protein VD713_02240 [Sphingomonadales bacterium]|nr:hypothetical protein [Sphingomonadales bacterium]
MLLLIAVKILSTVLLTQPVVLEQEPVTIALVECGNSALLGHIADLARDPGRSVALRLRNIKAEGSPSISWEVYAGPQRPSFSSEGPFFVGIFSGFGVTELTEFLFPLDRAILATGDRALHVTFLPVSGLAENGPREKAAAREILTIGEISLVLDEATQSPPPPK